MKLSVIASLLFSAPVLGIIDQALFDDMQYCAHFSADAYKLGQCGFPEGCPMYATYTSGAKGFLAVDAQKKWIVLSFRGTADDEDREIDGMIDQVPYNITGSEGCQGCMVHEGFQLACSRNIDTILTDLKVLKKNYPDYKIMITGHSLGGAETALCGTSIAHVLGPGSIRAISLAALRVGNKNFAAYQDMAFPNDTYCRVTSMADNVPQVLNASMGYVHSGNEYWITKEPNPTTADIVKCNGPEDPDCNAAAVKKAGTGDSSSGISKDHGIYFFSMLAANCTALDPVKAPHGA